LKNRCIIISGQLRNPPLQKNIAEAGRRNGDGDVKKLRNARKGEKTDITGSIAVVIHFY